MKKTVRAFFVALVIMIAAASVVLANGVKGFEPYKVPVDKSNLPEEVSEADLDGEQISAHRLEEIAKEKGDDVVIEGTDESTYTAKHNMLLRTLTKEKTAVNEPDEKPEEPSKYEEGSNTPPETGMGTTPDPGESENEEAPPAPHTHSYEWWHEEVNGLTHTNYYKCSCGDYYSESWNETPKENKKRMVVLQTATTQEGKMPARKKMKNNVDLLKNEPPAHKHSWEEVKTVVHHDAVVEKVWVVDRATYDEQVLVEEARDEPVTEYEYEMIPYYETGDGFVFRTAAEAEAHCPLSDLLEGKISDEEAGSMCYYNTLVEYVPVETVTYIHHDAEYKTVHHDEEGRWEEKVVTAAYDEEKVTGYKCSCGATK